MKLLKMQSWDFKTKKQRNCEKMLKTIMKLIENQIFKKKNKKKASFSRIKLNSC